MREGRNKGNVAKSVPGIQEQMRQKLFELQGTHHRCLGRTGTLRDRSMDFVQGPVKAGQTSGPSEGTRLRLVEK